MNPTLESHETDADEPRPNDPTTRLRVLLWGVLAVGLVVIVATVSDYGMSWDEPVHTRYAEMVLEYFSSGGKDTSCNRYGDMKYYGPVVDLAAALLYEPWPLYKVEIRHLVSALIALLTIPAIWKLGRLLGGEWAGLLGGLFLATSPQFYGQAFVNAKDIPFACGFAWTMLALSGPLARGTLRLADILGLGLAIGLTVAVRPGGWMLLGVLLPIAPLFAAIARSRRLSLRGLPWLAARLVAPIALAWTIMVVLWPWAHESPFRNPVKAILTARSYPNILLVLFEGRYCRSDQLPRTYLFESIALATPLPLLLLAGVGMAAGLAKLVREPRGPSSPALLVGLLWFFLPTALWTVLRTNIYDGIRHFLFVLPCLALWGGYGGAALLTMAGTRPLRGLAIALLLAAVLWPVRDLIRLHPYQMTYYNELAGGTGRASARFETDYWLTSYKEAMEWINRQAEARPDRTVSVFVAAHDVAVECANHYRGPGVVIRDWNFDTGLRGRLPAGIDYYLGTTRMRRDRNYPDAPVVKTIGREGALFAVIRGR